MPSSILLQGASLPRKLKQPFSVSDLPKDRANNLGADSDQSATFENPTSEVFEHDSGDTNGGLEDVLKLDKKYLTENRGNLSLASQRPKLVSFLNKDLREK